MPEQLMQCMEVWGGNQAVDSGIVMAGLDAWVYSKPFGSSPGGGDVYYLSSCATGRILRLLLADVSGHGQAVHNVATQLRGLMRLHVNHLDQGRFVRLMNQQFTSLSQEGCFATAIVSTFFAPTNRLTLCNAGHPMPLIFRASEGHWKFLQQNSTTGTSSDPVNLPLGIEDIADYQTFDVELEIGDLVLCYTDSLIESFDADGQMLGHAGLLEIVQSLDTSSPQRLTAALLEAVQSRCPRNLSNDDITVLLFRPNGKGRRTPTLGRQFSAAGKMLAAIARRVGGGEQVPWPDLRLPNIGGAVFPPLARLWYRRKSSTP